MKMLLKMASAFLYTFLKLTQCLISAHFVISTKKKKERMGVELVVQGRSSATPSNQW